MKKRALVSSVAALWMLAACVTINIYFPAEEVRNAADRIVNEVWGDEEAAPVAPAPEAAGPTSLLRFLVGPGTAWAQAVNGNDINVSTPQIRAIKQAMKQRTTALRSYLAGGQIGIGRDGLLGVRTVEGLDLRGRGQVARLVKAENEDRVRLYQEIAAEVNRQPNRSATAEQVQSIFAESWRAQAAPGWYLEGADGAWQRK